MCHNRSLRLTHRSTRKILSMKKQKWKHQYRTIHLCRLTLTYKPDLITTRLIHDIYSVSLSIFFLIHFTHVTHFIPFIPHKLSLRPLVPFPFLSFFITWLSLSLSCFVAFPHTHFLSLSLSLTHSHHQLTSLSFGYTHILDLIYSFISQVHLTI